MTGLRGKSVVWWLVRGAGWIIVHLAVLALLTLVFHTLLGEDAWDCSRSVGLPVGTSCSLCASHKIYWILASGSLGWMGAG